MPQTAPSRNGKCCVAIRRAAPHAPNPAKANWHNDSWPAKPVSTTTDSTRIAVAIVIVNASFQMGDTLRITIAVTATPAASRTFGTRPLPGTGRRASVAPRSSRARPMNAVYRTMMSTGTTSGNPWSACGLTPKILPTSG